MARAVELYSFIKNGQVSNLCRDAIVKALTAAEGLQVKITIKIVRAQRSNKQNAFYWGYVVNPILFVFREHGNNWDADKVHDFLRSEVGGLKEKMVLPSGELVDMLRSSTELTPGEFEDYLESIRAWSADILGIHIAFPNEDFQPIEQQYKDLLCRTEPK